jgi:hypothetical protein
MDAKCDCVRVDALRWKLHETLGVDSSFEDAKTLLKSAESLRRWYKAEQGYGRELLLRNEQGQALAYQLHGGRYDREHSRPVPDRESLALGRVAEVCSKYGLAYRTAHDWRGQVLYVFPICGGVRPQAVSC